MDDRVHLDNINSSSSKEGSSSSDFAFEVVGANDLTLHTNSCDMADNNTVFVESNHRPNPRGLDSVLKGQPEPETAPTVDPSKHTLEKQQAKRIREQEKRIQDLERQLSTVNKEDTVSSEDDADDTQLLQLDAEESSQTTENNNNGHLARRDSKKSLSWRDESPEDASLEDVRPFDKREPVDDISASSPSRYWPPGRKKAKSLLFRLYLSHFLSAWGDRMWEFASALLLISIWPDTLLLAALFGLGESSAVVFMGPLVGDWVDSNDRLRVVRKSLIVANGSVVLATILIAIILALDYNQHDHRLFGVLVAMLIISGMASKLGSLASTLAVEKEWVKILCEGDSEMLAETNARMRRIDLICKLVAPIFVGLIMTGSGPMTGTIVIGLWNFVSMFPEYIVLTLTYSSFPALKEPKATPVESEAKTSILQNVMQVFISLKSGWKIYSNLDVFRPALALALLYCTVLSFGSIMTAYAYNRGVEEATLAAFRGVGAAFGLLGTFIFPIMVSKRGLIQTGGISIWFQLVLLGLCIVSTFFSGHTGDCSEFEGTEHDGCIHDRNVEVGLLITGVVVSRCGLWMFDLAVTQMLQERVETDVIAKVNGVQSSIQNLLDMFSYLLGVILSTPDDFRFLAWISFMFVLFAVLLYTSFWRNGYRKYSTLESVGDDAIPSENSNPKQSPERKKKKMKKKKKKKQTGKTVELQSKLIATSAPRTNLDSSDEEMATYSPTPPTISI